jgi:hypothetical protein
MTAMCLRVYVPAPDAEYLSQIEGLAAHIRFAALRGRGNWILTQGSREPDDL